MRDSNYYSIRMHASILDRHVSGAERIVSGEKIDKTATELIGRALSKACSPDRITVTIDNLGSNQPRMVRALDVLTMNAADSLTARSIASRILLDTGVSASAVEQAMNFLRKGATPSGENMRGAMIVDAKTGERLEPDQTRGVRASMFDWSADAGGRIRKLLADNDLSHFRTYEALALATKIAYGPGVLAELCWSDDADYTAGYIASLRAGYVRFPLLKEKGDNKGGRAIFIDPSVLDIDALIHYLQLEAVLISDTGCCRTASPAEYSGSMHIITG